MILNTHPGDRKEMIRAISELIALPARYMGMPTCAYQIGGIIVDRDGKVSGDDEAALSAIRPMLIECGWMTEERKEKPASVIGREDVTLSVQDWTVAQLINLLRTFCSKQYLLNRMMQGDTLFIEESFVTAITGNPPADTADFEARVLRAAEAGCMCGIVFESGKLIVSTPYCTEVPERQKIFNDLFTGILKNAKTAARVSVRQQNDPENEKYHANSWMLRLGFSGKRYKELRRVLMHHLNGYAAFRSEADMLAHRGRYAQRRCAGREVAEQ